MRRWRIIVATSILAVSVGGAAQAEPPGAPADWWDLLGPDMQAD